MGTRSMFDTMTVTKAAGAVLGALLIFLLGKWTAEVLYHVGGHGEAAYVIETGESEALSDATEEATAEAPETPLETEAVVVEPSNDSVTPAEPVATKTASADAAAMAGDPEAGEKVFKKCKACHKTEDGKNAVGPYLFGVVGRPVASVDSFKYSAALAGKGGEWTVENLQAFLTKPSDFAKGTKMTFPGLPKQEDRDNVIAYLNTLN